MQKRPQDDADLADKSESSQVAESSGQQGPAATDKKYVYFDLRLEPSGSKETKASQKLGRIVIELHTNIAPKTCYNFLQLCRGVVGRTGKRLCYKESPINKIIPGFMVQGGDITNFDGTGGESIYGPLFEDESFEMKLVPGVVGMANNGAKDTNSSKFFIACEEFPHMQGSYVGFATVVKGYKLVEDMSNIPCVENRPTDRIIIDDCGELPASSDQWCYWENDGLDQYPPYPEDMERGSALNNWVNEAIEAVQNIKACGNEHFSEQRYDKAMQKYVKASRYMKWLKDVNKDVYHEHQDKHVACLLNQAKTNLFFKNFREASQQCSEALQMRPEDAKAYFRRGMANFGLHDYEAALEDLHRAQKLEPTDKLIRNKITLVKNSLIDCKNEEKRRFANVLN